MSEITWEYLADAVREAAKHKQESYCVPIHPGWHLTPFDMITDEDFENYEWVDVTDFCVDTNRRRWYVRLDKEE